MGGERRGVLAEEKTRMKRVRIGAVVLLAGLMGGVLTACDPGADPPPATPTPSSDEGLFSSNAEALAAASEAFEEILEETASVDPADARAVERYLEFFSGAALADTKALLEKYRELGYRSAGSSTVTKEQLYDLQPSQNSTLVGITLCVDTSDSIVLDSSGANVLPDADETIQPFKVEIVFSDQPDKFTMKGASLWDEPNYCE